MVNPREEFEEIIRMAIDSAYPSVKISENEIGFSISVPKGEHGDISSSVCLGLAKQVKTSPTRIAEELIKHMNVRVWLADKGVVEKVSNVNGYLNGWLNKERYTREVIEKIRKHGAKYGISELGKKKRVMVEFPSVNPNKPWHVGHLRNALLGDSISRILAFNSYEVEKEDFIDNLGLQMAEILWGLSWNDSATDGKYDQFLGELYVKVNKKMKEEKAEDEINDILKRMEKIGSEEEKHCREVSEMSVKGQYQTAFDYGIYHDVMVWESDIVKSKLLDSAMDLLKKKNIARIQKDGKFAGCLVVDVDKGAKSEDENIKVFIRSNGVATYIAKDFAFHTWKLGLLDPKFKYTEFVSQPNNTVVYSTSPDGKSMDFGGVDIAVNIIGSEQSYPQAVIKQVFKAMGHEEKSENIIHVAYGEVGMKEGSLSGRSGDWMGKDRNYTADDLLREMKEKTLEVIKNSEKVKDKTKEKEISEKIALAAIKFEFLRVDPEKKVTFEWDKALDLNLNSGPYAMYMYARASRIIEKAAVGFGKLKLNDKNYSMIERDYDFELVKMLGSAQDIIEKACREYRPNVIAEYLIDLSLLFGKFYEHMPVLTSDESKSIRLAIVMATRQVIYNMLDLLGIEAVESM